MCTFPLFDLSLLKKYKAIKKLNKNCPIKQIIIIKNFPNPE